MCKASARQAEDLGSNPSECHIFDVLSSLLLLRSVGRSNFDKDLHNLITLIQKRHKIMIEMKLLYHIYIYVCDCVHVYIYMYMQIVKKYVRDTLIPTILLKNATFRSS